MRHRPGHRCREILFISFLTASVGCTGANEAAVPTAPPRAAVASVAIAPAMLQLVPGAQKTLIATTLDAAGAVLTGRVINWSGADATIATVATDGTVTAHTVGIATMTATSEGKSATSTVIVTGGVGLACAGPFVLGCGLPVDQFSLLPVGNFDMGSTAGYDWEKPVHSVTLSRPFYLQKTEVTQGQWKAVMGVNPSVYTACGDLCPVENVSWDDVQLFLATLNARTPGVTYRLPTEAEWEYAARGGTTSETYDALGAIAWYGGNSTSRTHPVAMLGPNAWGLYDMLGNVWEWVSDWYGLYGAAAVTDPKGPSTGTYHVSRGGGFNLLGPYMRAASRANQLGTSGYDNEGFRLVRTP